MTPDPKSGPSDHQRSTRSPRGRPKPDPTQPLLLVVFLVKPDPTQLSIQVVLAKLTNPNAALVQPNHSPAPLTNHRWSTETCKKSTSQRPLVNRWPNRWSAKICKKSTSQGRWPTDGQTQLDRNPSESPKKRRNNEASPTQGQGDLVSHVPTSPCSNRG